MPLYFSNSTFRWKSRYWKNRMFYQLTFLEFLFGQKCKSVDPSKFCLSDKKRKSRREHFEIILFSIALVFVLLFHSIIQLIPFCLLFTYFKIKTWSNFSYFSRSLPWLERYFWAIKLKFWLWNSVNNLRKFEISFCCMYSRWSYEFHMDFICNDPSVTSF